MSFSQGRREPGSGFCPPISITTANWTHERQRFLTGLFMGSRSSWKRFFLFLNQDPSLGASLFAVKFVEFQGKGTRPWSNPAAWACRRGNQWKTEGPPRPLGSRGGTVPASIHGCIRLSDGQLYGALARRQQPVTQSSVGIAVRRSCRRVNDIYVLLTSSKGGNVSRPSPIC